MAAAKAIRGRGRPGKVEVIDILFAGPPPYKSADAWSPERVDDWGQKNLDWVCASAPHAFIVGAYVHRDERSPHMHVLMLPIAETGRLSWNRVEKGFAADPRLKGPDLFRSIQTRYHQDVAEHFDLERGVIGSNRRHEPINRSVGLVERVLDAPRLWSRKQTHEAGQEAIRIASGDRGRRRDAEVQRDRMLIERDAAVRDRDQAAASLAAVREQAAVAEKERDALAVERDQHLLSLATLLRDRDTARLARDAATAALAAERAVHVAEKKTWGEKLLDASAMLRESRFRASARERQAQRVQVPPTVAELKQAQEVATAATTAHRALVKTHNELVGGYNGLLQRWQDDHAVLSADKTAAQESRARDLAAARAAGVQEGAVQRDEEKHAASDRAKSIISRAADDVAQAERRGVAAGRADCVQELQTLRDLAEGLTTDTEAAEVDRDQALAHRDQALADRDAVSADLVIATAALKDVRASRDELWAERTASRTDAATPVRPASAGRAVTENARRVHAGR